MNAFAARVEAAQKEQWLSRPELARRAGVSTNILERLAKPQKPKPKRTTVIALCHALGLDIDAELAGLGYTPLTEVERARLPDLNDPWPELEQLRPRLTTQQKHALVVVARAFLGASSPLGGDDPPPDPVRVTPVKPTRTAGRPNLLCP